MSEVRAAARRSYRMSKASGSREETPRIRGHGRRQRGATLRLRPGAAGRSHLVPEARGNSLEEPPGLEARGSGREEKPEDQWLCGRRRA